MTDNTNVSSSGFYTPCEQPDNSSLAYCNADVSNAQTSSAACASVSDMHNVATSPELDTTGEVEDQQLFRQRQRSHSAPSVLYQQVALQLRDISDEFNREYSRDEADAAAHRPPQQGRRRSLPDIHRHEPHSPNFLHRMIQSFRRASNTPSRSHNSSISRVPEEDMDLDDELDLAT